MKDTVGRSKLIGKDASVLDTVRSGLGWSSKRTLAATATQSLQILEKNLLNKYL
jgi:hypothetical protein